MGKSNSQRRLGRIESSVDRQVLRATNDIWNKLSLNSPWSVGLVSRIIKKDFFEDFLSFKEFYFRSGQERSQLISGRFKEISYDLDYQPLRNDSFIKGDFELIQKMQFNYGRSPSILLNRAVLLQTGLKQSGVVVSVDDCFSIVKYRVLGETWNGIYIREHNAAIELSERFPNHRYLNSTGLVDFKYAVDLEVYLSSQLICAVQIKPISYSGGQEYILKAKKVNANKNEQFEYEYSVKVFTILCDEKGQILENESFIKLSNLLNQN